MAEHHERLAELAEAAGVERQAQRTLERELADAKAGLADLRDQLVSALADEDQPKAKQLAAKRAKREQAVEALGLRVDAAEQRAERASRARAEYHRDHAEDLIAELEPDAIAVGNELVESARALIAAEQRWRDLSQQTDTHLAAHQPGAGRCAADTRIRAGRSCLP